MTMIPFLRVEDASLSKLLDCNCSPKDYSSLSWGIDSKKELISLSRPFCSVTLILHRSSYIENIRDDADVSFRD